MDYFTNATVVPNISTLGNLDMALLKVLVPAAVVLLMSVVLYFSSDPDYSVTQGGETIRPLWDTLLLLYGALKLFFDRIGKEYARPHLTC
jgi:hypothetical protein